MALSEKNLVGWLCFLGHQWTHCRNPSLHVPEEVAAKLTGRGWVKVDGEIAGEEQVYLSPEGQKVFDLNAFDWGTHPDGYCPDEAT